jgi:hypothetical protein
MTLDNIPLTKTCFMRCPVADDALSLVHDAIVADAADNALPDPAPDVTPNGMPHCKNAGMNVHARRQIPRSSQAGGSAAANNLGAEWLGAGPASSGPRQLTPPSLVAVAHSVAVAGAAVPAHRRWPDNSDWLCAAASDGPPRDRPRNNNGFADKVV